MKKASWEYTDILKTDYSRKLINKITHTFCSLIYLFAYIFERQIFPICWLVPTMPTIAVWLGLPGPSRELDPDSGQSTWMPGTQQPEPLPVVTQSIESCNQEPELEVESKYSSMGYQYFLLTLLICKAERFSPPASAYFPNVHHSHGDRGKPEAQK